MKTMKRFGIILAVVTLTLALFATISSFTIEATNATGISGTEQAHINALQSNDPVARAKAAQALTGANSDVAITALLANLADSDPTAGYYTALALAASNNPTVLPSLVAELNNPDDLVRQRAALALSRMDGEIAADALVLSLEDSATALYAAEILVNMDDETAHRIVLTALADDKLTTRRHAVMTAIENADPVVQNFLLGRALGSPDLILRRNASELRDFIGG
jgi:HEAT repeat protein